MFCLCATGLCGLINLCALRIVRSLVDSGVVYGEERADFVMTSVYSTYPVNGNKECVPEVQRRLEKEFLNAEFLVLMFLRSTYLLNRDELCVSESWERIENKVFERRKL